MDIHTLLNVLLFLMIILRSLCTNDKQVLLKNLYCLPLHTVYVLTSNGIQYDFIDLNKLFLSLPQQVKDHHGGSTVCKVCQVTCPQDRVPFVKEDNNFKFQTLEVTCFVNGLNKLI